MKVEIEETSRERAIRLLNDDILRMRYPAGLWLVTPHPTAKPREVHKGYNTITYNVYIAERLGDPISGNPLALGCI